MFSTWLNVNLCTGPTQPRSEAPSLPEEISWPQSSTIRDFVCFKPVTCPCGSLVFLGLLKRYFVATAEERCSLLWICTSHQCSVSWYLYRICDSALRLLHLLNYIVKSNDLNMHQLRLVSCPLLICQMRLELNTWHCKLVKQEYLVLYNLGWKNTCPVLVVGTNVYVYRKSS